MFQFLFNIINPFSFELFCKYLLLYLYYLDFISYCMCVVFHSFCSGAIWVIPAGFGVKSGIKKTWGTGLPSEMSRRHSESPTLVLRWSVSTDGRRCDSHWKVLCVVGTQGWGGGAQRLTKLTPLCRGGQAGGGGRAVDPLGEVHWWTFPGGMGGQPSATSRAGRGVARIKIPLDRAS